MNLSIALTAARYGAATANYAEVLRLLKRPDPAGGKDRVCGVRCRDVLTGGCGGLSARQRWHPWQPVPWAPRGPQRPVGWVSAAEQGALPFVKGRTRGGGSSAVCKHPPADKGAVFPSAAAFH